MFRFLHASDLHLGAAFQGIRADSPAMAGRLTEATYRALERIVDLAVAERVAFVVLAGDLFNKADGNLRAWMKLRDAAARLDAEGIATFTIRGNHDYLGGGDPPLQWPALCRHFGSREKELHRLEAAGGAVQLFGRSHDQRAVTANLALSYPTPDPGLFAVALLHTNCGSNPDHASYAPCCVADLQDKGYGYWALGHIHKQGTLQAGKPLIAYAGCPQGLNPKETGPRGCLLVTVDDDQVATAEFRETDDVRWHMESVDIGGMSDIDDALAALDDIMLQLRPDDPHRAAAVRLRLQGRGPLHAQLRKPGAARDLLTRARDSAERAGGQVWPESLTSATQPEVDAERMAGSDSFVGDFLRHAAQLRQDPSALADLRQDLGQLLGHRGVGDALRDGGSAADEIWNDGRLLELLQEATAMGLDQLAPKEGAA